MSRPERRGAARRPRSTGDPATWSQADALPPPLGTLFARILAAKAAQRRQAAQKVRDPSAQADARRESLQALEAYADALERRCWPVPRRIQQDIRLHRALCRMPRT